jgi:hypothetical protein
MGWFIFVGDMLVMLFMTVLVIWVGAGATRRTLDYSARIPLEDELLPHSAAAKGGKESVHHG